MQLHLYFDEQTLRRYHERSNTSFFGIYWQHENTFYPSSNWTDFGSTILGWWVTAAINLFHGSRNEELLFMDGPFCIKVTRKEALLDFAADELSIPCECSLQQFISLLIEAATLVVDELKRIDVDHAGQRSLTIGIKKLRDIVSSQ